MLVNANHYAAWTEPKAVRATDDRTKNPLNAARGVMIAAAICTAFWGALGVAFLA